RRRLRHRVVDADDAVDDRILAVQAQVDELGRDGGAGHGRILRRDFRASGLRRAFSHLRSKAARLGKMGARFQPARRVFTIVQFVNLAGYKFVRLDGLPALRDVLRNRCLALDLKGTILISPEGINAFLAGTSENVDAFRSWLNEDERFADLR